MDKPKESPSLGHELATLADLYLTFLWMMRQRLQYGRGWQYQHRWSPAHDNGIARNGSPVGGELAATAKR